MVLFVCMYLNTCKNTTTLLLSFVWGRLLQDFMPLKQVSYSGRVGEGMDFSPLCLPCHFLSPQKIRASSASCSREFQVWVSNAQRTPSFVSKPTTCYFQYILPHSMIGRDSEKWFLGHLLYATLILTVVISSKYCLSLFSKQFQLPNTIVLLWFFISSWSFSVEFLFNKVHQSLNNAKLGFECFPITWACKFRNRGVACFILFIIFWENGA